jgi:hypothetical protein
VDEAKLGRLACFDRWMWDELRCAGCCMGGVVVAFIGAWFAERKSLVKSASASGWTFSHSVLLR